MIRRSLSTRTGVWNRDDKHPGDERGLGLGRDLGPERLRPHVCLTIDPVWSEAFIVGCHRTREYQSSRLCRSDGVRELRYRLTDPSPSHGDLTPKRLGRTGIDMMIRVTGPTPPGGVQGGGAKGGGCKGGGPHHTSTPAARRRRPPARAAHRPDRRATGRRRRRAQPRRRDARRGRCAARCAKPKRCRKVSGRKPFQ